MTDELNLVRIKHEKENKQYFKSVRNDLSRTRKALSYAAVASIAGVGGGLVMLLPAIGPIVAAPAISTLVSVSSNLLGATVLAGAPAVLHKTAFRQHNKLSNAEKSIKKASQIEVKLKNENMSDRKYAQLVKKRDKKLYNFEKAYRMYQRKTNRLARKLGATSAYNPEFNEKIILGASEDLSALKYMMFNRRKAKLTNLAKKFERMHTDLKAYKGIKSGELKQDFIDNMKYYSMPEKTRRTMHNAGKTSKRTMRKAYWGAIVPSYTKAYFVANSAKAKMEKVLRKESLRKKAVEEAVHHYIDKGLSEEKARELADKAVYVKGYGVVSKDDILRHKVSNKVKTFGAKSKAIVKQKYSSTSKEIKESLRKGGIYSYLAYLDAKDAVGKKVKTFVENRKQQKRIEKELEIKNSEKYKALVDFKTRTGLTEEQARELKAKVDKRIENAILAYPAMSEKQARYIAETKDKYEIEGYGLVSVKNLVDLESRRKAKEEESLKKARKTTVATTKESIGTEISKKAKTVGTKVKTSAKVLGTETAKAIKEVGKAVKTAGSGLNLVVEGVKAKQEARKATKSLLEEKRKAEKELKDFVEKTGLTEEQARELKAKVDKRIEIAILANPAMSEKQARYIAETEDKYEIEGYGLVSVKNLVDLESRRKAEEEEFAFEPEKESLGKKFKKATTDVAKEIGNSFRTVAFGLKDMGKKIIDRDSLNNVVDDSGYWNADVKAEDIPKYEDDGNNRNWLENVANASKILDEHQK